MLAGWGAFLSSAVMKKAEVNTRSERLGISSENSVIARPAPPMIASRIGCSAARQIAAATRSGE